VQVGVDGTSWLNRRGYGRFARNAVGRLAELDPETRYIFYVDDASADKAGFPHHAEVRRVTVGRPPSEAAASGSRRGVPDVLRMTLAASRDGLDAFLFPSVHTYFPVFRVPTLVGLHDTIDIEYPQLTLPTRGDRMFAAVKRTYAVRRATRLFTVSEASRQALAERLGISRERLEIVPEAPDPVFHPRSGPEVDRVLADRGLRPCSYLLYAGGISPHKNVELLVETYCELVRSKPGTPPLVLVGELERDPFFSSATSVRSRVRELGVGERVLMLGFVEDEALACFYSAASAVVLPSLAEGFGLPAVEAAACGAALILSDLPAHRETLDDAALFVSPSDAAALSDAVARLLDDGELRSSLAERARAAVSILSWDASAEVLRRLVAETAAAGRRRRG
jgi:alpha-1,3-rhamnosyl/mannosyltransferase